MKNEIWKDVAGYEGLYQVSSEGRVKSLARVVIRNNGQKLPIKERILKPAFNGRGYLIVDLCDGGKRKHFKVHRLVCQAFHENPDNKPQVNHIDEDTTNNRASNLEWVTAKENVNHGTRTKRMAKTNSKPVGQYTKDGEPIKVWQSATVAERQAGFNYQHICDVANGNRKTHKGFIWKYV